MLFVKLEIETEDSKIEIKKSHKDLKEIFEQQKHKADSSNQKMPLNEQKTASRPKLIYTVSKKK